DLLPVGPADVSDPQIGGSRADREAKGVAETGGHDAVGAGDRAAAEGIPGRRGAGQRVDAEELSPVGRAAVSPHAGVVGTTRPALAGGHGLGTPQPDRWVVAGVERAPGVAEVHVEEARALTPARVEVAVVAEGDGPDRVAGELLAPVLHQHLLVARHRVAARLQA